MTRVRTKTYGRLQEVFLTTEFSGVVVTRRPFRLHTLTPNGAAVCGATEWATSFNPTTVGRQPSRVCAVCVPRPVDRPVVAARFAEGLRQARKQLKEGK